MSLNLHWVYLNEHFSRTSLEDYFNIYLDGIVIETYSQILVHEGFKWETLASKSSYLVHCFLNFTFLYFRWRHKFLWVAVWQATFLFHFCWVAAHLKGLLKRETCLRCVKNCSNNKILDHYRTWLNKFIDMQKLQVWTVSIAKYRRTFSVTLLQLLLPSLLLLLLLLLSLLLLMIFHFSSSILHGCSFKLIVYNRYIQNKLKTLTRVLSNIYLFNLSLKLQLDM